jgi:hypothetical protein
MEQSSWEANNMLRKSRHSLPFKELEGSEADEFNPHSPNLFS